MEQKREKIGIREYVAIVILALGAKVADDTPAMLFEKLDTAAWMAPILIGILAILPVFLLLKVLSAFPNNTFMDVTQIIFGKAIGYILILFLWVIGTFTIVIDTSIYTDIIGTMYFSKTPTFIVYLVLMAISAYGAKRGLESIGSVAWSVLPYIKVSLFIALILTMSHGQISFLAPIFGPGKWEIVKQSSFKISIFADLLFIGAIAPFVASAKDYKKGTWIALIIVIIDLTMALIAYLFLFDFESVKMLNYPFHEAIRYISIGFIINLETFFFPFWIITSFVRFSFYLYLSGMFFGWLFKVKNFEYIIPTFATLFIFLGMIPETPTFTVYHLRKTVLNIITPIFFFLPILFWTIAKFKGVFNHDQNSE
ncbi:GerAB/ArcD/ProY family transporter [Bacillus sp. CGMCC 1.16607]|uniref:GerAB/ArcD/ProY family transporter n=1 Tax=Bacillus sp. CGMCC 1.16607 TaxID=3351842 RepID=UPI00362AFAC7